jgi:HTH domain
MILRTLGARRLGMSVRELAEDRGVDRQTIRRDPKLLQNLGFPLVESTGPRGRKTWSFPRNEGCPHLQFAFDCTPHKMAKPSRIFPLLHQRSPSSNHRILSPARLP